MKVALWFYLIWSLFTGAQTPTIYGKFKTTLSYGFSDGNKRLIREDFDWQFSKLDNVAQGTTNFNAALSRKITGFGPVFFKEEYSLNKKVGIGITLGYAQVVFKNEFDPDKVGILPPSTPHQQAPQFTRIPANSYKLTSLSIGTRITYCFFTDSKQDVFFGLSTGYTLIQIKTTGGFEDNPFFRSPDLSYPYIYKPKVIFDPNYPFYLGMTLGYRQYFLKNLGLSLEVGFDKTAVFQAGLVFRTN